MAAKKKRRASKRSKQRKKGVTERILSTLFWLVLISVGLLAGAYFFGSVELRTEIERRTTSILYSMRDAGWMPKPLGDLLATLEDQVPDAEVFVVDAEEAGRDRSHFIAGIPRGIKNLAVAHQESRSTLYNKARKTVCIAARIKGSDLHEYPVQWDHEIWSGLVQMLARDYPQRFEEVWLYTGPIYSENASGKPNGFFAIAFDITDSGGLRAISFQVPANASTRDFSTYLTTISTIEQATQLRLTPQLEIGTQQSLSTWKESRIW